MGLRSLHLSYICVKIKLPKVKRIYCLLAIVYCLFVFSCGEKGKEDSIPSNILPKEKMAQIIGDIHLAEAQVNLRAKPDTTLKNKLSFQKIFEKDSITKQQYEESLAFYIDHPELLDKVYEETLNELSKMQASSK